MVDRRANLTWPEMNGAICSPSTRFVARLMDG